MRELSNMRRVSEKNEKCLGVRGVEKRANFVCRVAVGNINLMIYTNLIISSVMLKK